MDKEQRVTAKDLMEKGGCQDGIAEFIKKYGYREPVSINEFYKFCEHLDDLDEQRYRAVGWARKNYPIKENRKYTYGDVFSNSLFEYVIVRVESEKIGMVNIKSMANFYGRIHLFVGDTKEFTLEQVHMILSSDYKYIGKVKNIEIERV